MLKFIVFLILSIPIVIFSYRSLKVPQSHGFPRFFGWEGLLWLAVSNSGYWFNDPFTIPHLLSWIFLFCSIYLVVAGIYAFSQKGKAHASRQDQTLFSFEKTTELVDSGVFRFIRHPMYGSLIFLTWGIFLKQPALWSFLLTLFSSLMFFLTAKRDEKECIIYFGDAYIGYIKRTKMFIPYVF